MSEENRQQRISELKHALEQPVPTVEIFDKMSESEKVKTVAERWSLIIDLNNLTEDE